jgi:hypothetical protein
MSSSYRKFRSVRAAVLAALGLVASVGVAEAAQTFIEPQAELRAETNSNLTLDPDGSPDGYEQGYIAEVLALMGVATPQSETSFRPRLRFQEYPDRDERDRVEAFADLFSRYRWERSRFDLVAKYSRQDSYNFDTRSGTFDPLDPNYGTDPGTGRVLEDETRSEIDVRPEYAFDVSERTTVGIDARYRSVWYDADSDQPEQIDYEHLAAGANVSWKLDPRNKVGVGAFVNTYDPKSGSGDSDGYGIGAGYEHRWSETTGFEMTAFYETNDPKSDEPGVANDSTSGFGGTVAAFHEGEVSKWRFSASHRLAPNANGRAEELDQLRLQYDREFSERLTLRAVARYESESDINDDGSQSIDTARADLSLRWRFTQMWDVQGGYSYIGRDEGIDGDASNNRFFVSVGYEGLGRQRR